MLKIYPDILSISDEFPAFLLDAYGVFWGGGGVGMLPHAKETMKALANQKKVGILSNTTQTSAKEKEKLAKHGIIEGIHYHFFISSGDVVKAFLREKKLSFPTPRMSYALFMDAHPLYSSQQTLFEGSDYQETSIEEADFLFLPVPNINGQDQVDPKVFEDIVLRKVSSKLPLLCPNPDLFAHEGKPPRLVVRQGSIADMYKKLGGSVFYIGKPYASVYERALEEFVHLGIMKKDEILMVGDTPETDIRGAKNIGIKSALVTQTGIMKDRKLSELQDIPDYYLERFSRVF